MKHKVVLVGNGAVGKTSIITRLQKGTFTNTTDPTIGASFVSHFFNIENKSILLHIWDTAGQEMYRSLIPMYSRGADAVLVVFDVTSQDSFVGAQNWCKKIITEQENSLLYLVANKCDLEPVIDLAAAKNYVENMNGKFFITSAKSGAKIQELFNDVAISVDSIPNNHDTEPPNTTVEVVQTPSNENQNNKGLCC